jgi:TrmH family RNA methyltransferase
VDIITSPGNRIVKSIRALKDRGAREESGTFFVEGIRIVTEAALTGADIVTLVVAPELLTSAHARELWAAQRARGTRCVELSAEVFRGLSSREGPQGIGAVVRERWRTLADLTPQASDLWVALDAVQDPGNLGTVMRTADAVGCRGVVLIGHAADPFDPGAVRASMGSIFNLEVARTSAGEFLRWKSERGCPVFGATGDARCDYRSPVYPRPLVLLGGSERQGIDPLLLPACDGLVSIPMVGRTDSLNLAVAMSLVLYEAFRQRQPAGERPGGPPAAEGPEN